MKRIRIIGLAVVAVFALGAVAASAASAHNFKAEVSPVTVNASSTFGSPAVEHLQGFQASNAVSVCKKATFAGTGTSGSETLEVHPEYKECFLALSAGKSENAEVVTTGCNYKFHAAAPETHEGRVDIVCTGSEGIKVLVPTLKCEVLVPPQTGLEWIEYVNQGTLSLRKVLVKANVTKITYKSTCVGVEVKEGKTAEYRAGKFSALGTPEMGTGPAEALSEGKAAGEADGVWVE